MTKGYILSPIEPIALSDSLESRIARIKDIYSYDVREIKRWETIKKSVFVLPGATFTFYFFSDNFFPFGFDVETIDIN